MTIQSEQCDQNPKVVFISGRLDTASSSEFDVKVHELVDGSADIILDFKDLSYISSSGLHVLIQAHKKLTANNRKLIIRNANGLVSDVFKMTGFCKIVTMEG